MINKDKRAVGGLEFLKAFMIGLAVVVVLAFALSLMNAQLYSSATPTTVSSSVTNETGYANSTGYTVSVYNTRGFKNPVVTELWNRTSGDLIGSGNATISSAGIVTNGSATQWNNLSISFSYDYETDSNAQSIIGNFSNGLSTLGSNVSTWITLASLVVIVGIIAVVIYLVSRFGGSSEMG